MNNPNQFIYKREDPLVENELNLVRLFLLCPSKHKDVNYMDVDVSYIYKSNDIEIKHNLIRSIRIDKLNLFFPDPKKVKSENNFLLHTVESDNEQFIDTEANFSYNKCRTAVLKQHRLIREYIINHKLSLYL